MKILELVKHLQGFDPDLEVVFRHKSTPSLRLHELIDALLELDQDINVVFANNTPPEKEGGTLRLDPIRFTSRPTFKNLLYYLIGRLR